jgi:hypothetical protein
MSPSIIWRAAVSGPTLATFLASISGKPAMLCGVPRLRTMANTWSELISLLKFWTALGTWYAWSSTTKRILRPWMPPFAFASSKMICAALMAPTLNAANGPERSPFDPMTTSVSVTPCVACATEAMPSAKPAARMEVPILVFMILLR